jgi:hypothetical protein
MVCDGLAQAKIKASLADKYVEPKALPPNGALRLLPLAQARHRVRTAVTAAVTAIEIARVRDGKYANRIDRKRSVDRPTGHR